MQHNHSGPVFRLLLVAATMCVLTVAPRRASAAYDYAYGVNDPSSGDIKDQQESRDGDQVTGYYRLLDSDGLVRTVNYASNPRTGFQAQVTRESAPPFYDAAAPTSYQQHTRPMSGYRSETVHPTARIIAPIIAPYGY